MGDSPFIHQVRTLVAERWVFLVLATVVAVGGSVALHVALAGVGAEGTTLATMASWLPVAVLVAMVLYLVAAGAGHPDLGSESRIDLRDREFWVSLARSALLGAGGTAPALGVISTGRGDVIAAAYLMLIGAMAPAGIASIGTGTSQWGARRVLRIADGLPLVLLQAAGVAVVACLAGWVVATALPAAAGAAVAGATTICALVGLALELAAPPAVGDQKAPQRTTNQAPAIPASTALPASDGPPAGPVTALPATSTAPAAPPATGPAPADMPQQTPAPAEEASPAPSEDRRQSLAWRLARLGGARVHEEWVWIPSRGVLSIEFDAGNAVGLTCEVIDASGRRVALPAPTEGSYATRIEVPSGWFAVVLRGPEGDACDVNSVRVVELHVLFAANESSALAQVSAV